MTLLYEDLLEDPRHWLRTALGFCGIMLNESALHYVMADTESPSPSQVAFKHHGLYSEDELRWVSEVLLSWDPTTPPWLAEQTPRRTRWAVHPRIRQSTPWGQSYLFDGLTAS